MKGSPPGLKPPDATGPQSQVGFSWSKTRDDVFRLCPRRYYYEYYASRGGWDESAPQAARELYILKKLKTRQMWAGDLIHRAVQRTMTNLARGVAVLDVARIVEITLNIMRNEYRSSLHGNYRHSRGAGLLEHEYALPVGATEWRDLAAGVERCLRNFYASALYRDLALLPREEILQVENLSSFDFEGVRCWVVLDAAWRGREGLTIADWKTGLAEPGGHELQMTCYALFAAGKWNTPPAEMVLLEYNLASDRMHRYTADAATVGRTSSYIRGSIADMRSMLAEGDCPLPEESFIRTASLDVCRLCNYRRICRPGLS